MNYQFVWIPFWLVLTIYNERVYLTLTSPLSLFLFDCEITLAPVPRANQY